MEKYDVTLYDLKRAVETSAVVYVENDISDEIIMKITVKNSVVSSKSNGYFQAYQELRDKLLKKGFGLKCSGSLINANQSAMMSYTSKIYLVKLGKQALKNDIADIWSYCDMDSFPDTKEQNKYTEKWFQSLKDL